MYRILFVDDEKSMCEFFDILLTNEGYQCTTTMSGVSAIQQLSNNAFDMIISDIYLPDLSGIEILKKSKEKNKNCIVIMITAYASTESAVQAMKLGAYDYIMKPFNVEEVKVILKKAFQNYEVKAENKKLKDSINHRYQDFEIIGKNTKMNQIYATIDLIKDSKMNVLITGESGTGKDLVARAIHFGSKIKTGPFVVVNCGAIPQTLIESELFGYVKGAFTGADSNKKGLFRAAHQGTLFLDEVGELPLHTQVKLLRVIQEKSFLPIGGTEEISVDVRIITATNRKLKVDVASGKFREDLYYRLKVVEIDLPPLRERRDDIPLLAERFLKKKCEQNDLKISKFSPAAMERLIHYDFFGNVRELENIIERSLAFEKSEEVQVSSLPPELQGNGAELGFKLVDRMQVDSQIDLDSELNKIEGKFVVKALDLSRGDKINAAKMLNISLRSLRYRIQKLNLKEYSNEK
jgi:two-component system response regulator PilR (NtrC family)